MRAWQFITVGSTCLLAACAGAQNSPPPPQPAAEVSHEAPSSASTAAPQAPTSRQPVRESVRATPAPEPTPDILIGLASTAVDNLLGSPELVRLDGNAEVRLYRDANNGCTFHVFLYVSDPATRNKSVEYFEARNQGARLEGAGLTDCYRALVKPAETS